MSGIIIPTAFFIICFLGLNRLVGSGFDLYLFYSEKMQNSLFVGFLTIGGFLLSLKTFILVKLKEGLYDSPGYQERFMKKKELDTNKCLTLYGPFKRLGIFLVYCVLAALITSTMQFSVGFINSGIAAAVCISAAASTLTLVFLAWWEIRCNLKEWFESIEEFKDSKGQLKPMG